MDCFAASVRSFICPSLYGVDIYTVTRKRKVLKFTFTVKVDLATCIERFYAFVHHIGSGYIMFSADHPSVSTIFHKPLGGFQQIHNCDALIEGRDVLVIF